MAKTYYYKNRAQSRRTAYRVGGTMAALATGSVLAANVGLAKTGSSNRIPVASGAITNGLMYGGIGYGVSRVRSHGRQDRGARPKPLSARQRQQRRNAARAPRRGR